MAATYTQIVAGFIPEVWTKKLLRLYDDKFPLRSSGVLNMEYEGEIKDFGDTVRARYLGNVTVNDYNNDETTPITYSDISGGEISWTIDQRKYWAFKVEDLEQAQSDIKDQKNKYMDRAAVAVKDTIETHLLGTNTYSNIMQMWAGENRASQGQVYWQAATNYAANDVVVPVVPNGYWYKVTTDGGSSDATEPTWPVVPGATVVDSGITWTCMGPTGFDAVTDKSNVYKTLVRAKKALKRTNAWDPGKMWVAFPPDIIEFLETSEELIHATNRGDQIIQQGFFGELTGWKILETNNLTGIGTAASPFHCVGGNSTFLHFAEQFVKTRAVDLENEFAIGVAGLTVYGSKVFSTNKNAGIDIQVTLG